MVNKDLPSGWGRKPLHAVAKVQTGIAKGKKPNGESISLPYLRVANVQDGYLDLSEVKRIEVSPKDVNRYLLREGDVLLTEGGDFDKLGRGHIWQGELPVCLHQNHIFAVRTDRRVLDPRFFAALAASSYGKRYFLSCAKQTTNLASINSTQLREFPVPLPPLPEQRKIAEILGTWDEAIGLLERRIAAARERKKGLMQRLLTGQVRFPGFTEPWREVRLGQMGRVTSGGTPGTGVPSYWAGGIPWCTPAEITGLGSRFIMHTRRTITREGLRASSAVLLPARSLLVCTRATVGDCAIAYVPMATNQGFKNLVPAREFDVEFLYYLLTFKKHALLRTASGSTFPELSKKEFEALRFSLPTLREQCAIAGVLAVCDEEAELLTRKLSSLQEQKKGLMQRLLTGEVRVTALLEADLERAVPIYRELAGLGWVPETADVSQRIVSICDFLGIESLAETPTLRRAARQTRTREPLRIAEIAWGKRVERLASQQKVRPYLPAALRDAIPDLLDYASEPADVAHVPGFLAKYGVHFVILRHLEQTYLDGALLYTDERPIIALTLRHRHLDRFWFTLMHELAHLLLGHEGIYLDTIDEPSDPTEDEEEREANRQAEDWLIDRAAIKRLRQNRYLSYADVARFAQERGLHPSIVAGRIRYERGDHRLFHDFDVTINSYLESWRDQGSSPADVDSG